MTKYLEIPALNAVKSDILKLNTEIIEDEKPKFEFKTISDDILIERIKNPHKNVVRMLLKMIAYNKQDNLLPLKWEVEHILPVRWENNYFLLGDIETAKEKVEHIGNKIPFEKRLNIIASNNYFSRKKELYIKSNIEITKKIAESNLNTWNLDSIIERDIEVSNEIIEIIRKWNKDYLQINETPTEEDLKKIEYFKSKGWL